MHATTQRRRRETGREPVAHRWVGAALVGMGEGENRRAEHAARTGRHVLPAATRIEVLEVYCARCRAGYSESARRLPCTGLLSRAG